MSISLFSHDVNPSVDPRLCRKSNSYVAQLVREGRAFMLDERRAQLYAPTQDTDSGRRLQRPPITRGRNSCRKITNEDGELVRYVVKHFHYSIPRHGLPLGARGKGMPARTINEPPRKPLGP